LPLRNAVASSDAAGPVEKASAILLTQRENDEVTTS
jgi:hypothetical protein